MTLRPWIFLTEGPDVASGVVSVSISSSDTSAAGAVVVAGTAVVTEAMVIAGAMVVAEGAFTFALHSKIFI